MIRRLLLAACLLAAPHDTAPAAQDPPADDQARIYRQMGLEPVPFNAEAIGLSLHLPEQAHIQVRQLGDRPAFVVGDGPEPRYWRMQIESVRLAPPDPGSEIVLPDVDAFLDRILSRQTDYQVLLRDDPRWGGTDARVCYIQRTPPSGEAVINGWVVLASGRSALLVISISVLPDVFPDYKPILDQSFGTIRIRTEEQRNLEHRARIEHGRTLLASITPERLRSLVGERQWFRTYRVTGAEGAKVESEIACSLVEVLAAPRGELHAGRDAANFSALEREEGLMVRVLGRVVVDARRDMYIDTGAAYWMSWDQSREAWSILVTRRQGQASRTEAETGVRTEASVGSPIPRLTVVGTEPTPYEWEVPEVYLSQALAWLLGRLLPRDGTEPAFFTYYFYNTRGSLPDLTLRYDRWEPMDDGSGHWQLATLLARDQPPDVTVYASDGTLIRRTRPNGDITEPMGREQILRLWQSKGLRTGPTTP